MTGMLNPIFINTDEAKSTTIPMPDAQADWPDFLTNELYKQHPSLTGKTARVVFQAQEEEQGYAVGSVEIREDGILLMYVPFIIEAKKLYPMDIYFRPQKKGEPMPLNEARIREAFFQSKIMDGLAPPPRRGDITDVSGYLGLNEPPADRYVHPPQTMGIAKWSSDKQSIEGIDVFQNVQDHLEDTPQDGLLKEAVSLATKERIETFKDDLLSVDGAIAMRKLAHSGLLSGWNDIINASNNAPSQSSINEAELWDGTQIETVRLKKEGADRYTAYVTFTSTMLPFDEKGNPVRMMKISKMHHGEAVKLVETISSDPEQVMQSTERSGEKIISAIRHNPDQHVNLVEDLVPEKFVQAPESGPHKVNVYDQKAGGSLKGYLFGDTVNLKGEKTSGKLFISDDSFAFQPRMSVEILSGTLTESRVPRIKYDLPSAGMVGTYIKESEDKKTGTALVPFKVLKLVRCNGRDAITVETNSGVQATLIPSYGIKSISPISDQNAKKELGPLAPSSGDIYMIPEDYNFVSLGYQRDVASDPREAMKTAADDRLVTTFPVRLIHDDGTFHMRGDAIKHQEWFSKLGYNVNAASPVEALHILVASGVPEDVSVNGIEKAAKEGKSTINCKRRKAYADGKKWSKKEAEISREIMKRELRGIELVTTETNLLKTASVVPDTATVNNILSLRFISPETFYHFASKIPMMEKTLSFLCTLLLTSRLDSSVELDEPEISSAVRLVDNIIQKLKKMKAILMPAQ